MIKKIAISVVSATMLLTSPLLAKDSSIAERGALFYEFEDTNSSKEQRKNNLNSQTKGNPSQTNVTKILEELLKVAKEQRDIQKEILEALKEEFNPTPQKVVVNGVECIANSSADCFVMPLTKDAKRIPVIKELVTNPTPETAKNYLQWQAKYLNTGPFKVGRSFEYAMNTYGDEAYPMNLARPDANSVTDVLRSKREKAKNIILNGLYKKGDLSLYIFLQANTLDFFSIEELSYIADSFEDKKLLTFVFKTDEDKKKFFDATKGNKYREARLSGITVVTNEESFKVNNIHMTPTYLAAHKKGKTPKKQAVAIGRVSSSGLNNKIYEWIEQEGLIERGKVSDYKIWDIEKVDSNDSK